MSETTGVVTVTVKVYLTTDIPKTQGLNGRSSEEVIRIVENIVDGEHSDMIDHVEMEEFSPEG